VKDEQAKATTASTIGDEYLKILYSEVCRCDKMVSVRPRIGGKLGNHTFLLRVLQKLGDIDNDMLAAVKDDEIGVNSLFSSDLDDEGDGERATNYALLPPQHLPLTVADTEVTQTVQVNKVVHPYHRHKLICFRWLCLTPPSFGYLMDTALFHAMSISIKMLQAI